MRIGTFIVDDVEDMRRLMRIVIDADGSDLFVMGEAASGQEALDYLETCDPDVVVLDQVMPGMDGLQTAASILQRRAGQPIILFSAYLDVDRGAEARALGVTVLSKIDFGELPSTIRDIAEGVTAG